MTQTTATTAAGSAAYDYGRAGEPFCPPPPGNLTAWEEAAWVADFHRGRDDRAAAGTDGGDDTPPAADNGRAVFDRDSRNRKYEESAERRGYGDGLHGLPAAGGGFDNPVLKAAYERGRNLGTAARRREQAAAGTDDSGPGRLDYGPGSEDDDRPVPVCSACGYRLTITAGAAAAACWRSVCAAYGRPPKFAPLTDTELYKWGYRAGRRAAANGQSAGSNPFRAGTIAADGFVRGLYDDDGPSSSGPVITARPGGTFRQAADSSPLVRNDDGGRREREDEDAGYRDGYCNVADERRGWRPGENPAYDRGFALGRAGKDGHPNFRFSRRNDDDDEGGPPPGGVGVAVAGMPGMLTGEPAGGPFQCAACGNRISGFRRFVDRFDGPNAYHRDCAEDDDRLRAIRTAQAVGREAVADGGDPVAAVVEWQNARERNAARIAAAQAAADDGLTTMQRAIAYNKSAWGEINPDDDRPDLRAQKLAEDLNAALARSAALEDEPRDVRERRRAVEEGRAGQ